MKHSYRRAMQGLYIACIALSARSGEGLDAWFRWLENARVEASGPRAVAEPAAQRA